MWCYCTEFSRISKDFIYTIFKLDKCKRSSHYTMYYRIFSYIRICSFVGNSQKDHRGVMNNSNFNDQVDIV